MPIINTDTIRPDGGPIVINGYDPTSAQDFLSSVSDGTDLTFVTQTADSNDFRALEFENTPSSGTANFADADSIDQIIFNIRCRCFRGAMNMEISLRDNIGFYPTINTSVEELTFTTLQTTFTTNTASDPINTSTIKGLQVSVFTTSGQAGGTGEAFRLIISDIFVTIISSNIAPTQTITLDSGAITLDSGKITVQ